jgi:RND family efflux transporter MFP subunit
MADEETSADKARAEPSNGSLSKFLAPGRTRSRVVAVGCLLGAVGAGCVVLSGRDAEPATNAQVAPALTVTVTSAQRAIWSESVAASGVIAPWQEASVGAQIGGHQLTEVRVNIGDQVKRGQVLARFDTAMLRAEEAQLLARYEQANVNSRRAADLQAAGAISDQEVLALATEAKSATALLAAKQLELRYASVVAPDDGVISARTATLGAVASPGQELFRMIRKNRLEWRGELTAAQLEGVAAGQTINLQLPDGSQAQAKVRQIAPSMDTQSRLAIVYADLAPGSHARAGMYVNGEIALAETPALTVPAECVVVRDGRSYVVQLDDAAMPAVKLLAVTPGRRHDDAIEILSGLSGKERLVRRGAGFLNDGDVVQVAVAPKANS